MLLDYNSLLLAIAFSGSSLCLTLFMAWLVSKRERYLLAGSSAMLLVVAGAGMFALYTIDMLPLVGLASFALLILGFIAAYAAARQFGRREASSRTLALFALASVVPVAVPFLLGYDGLGSILGNCIAAAILFAVARIYWGMRREAPLPLAVVAALYVTVGVSFLICGIMIAVVSPLVLQGPLENWAEDLNVIVSIIGITGIGALSLALNQSREAQIHRNDALTDGLTGLLNRRALFDRFGVENLPALTAVIVFDLDEFKNVNDQYGHATGDEVLRRFTAAITHNVRPTDVAARLGGEEFALVLPRCTPEMAALMAERIRASFESEVVDTDAGPLHCTVSAGFAVPDGGNASFGSVLRGADNALYLAKRSGRNRVASWGLHLVA
ncbi:MAG: diguanylate cyclase [Hyphomicrobiales bacterium]|nr:diguanylate cyclase [Hyphomicrobiales bacterium]